MCTGGAGKFPAVAKPEPDSETEPEPGTKPEPEPSSAPEFESALHLARSNCLVERQAEFDWAVFLGYLLMHALYPVSLIVWWPLNAFKLGPRQATLRINFQQFIPFQGKSSTATFFNSCALIAAHVLSFSMAVSADTRDQICLSFVWPSLLVFDFYVVMYYITVASKYAYMSHDERDKFSREKSRFHYDHQMRQLQLLSSWINVNVPIVLAEVERVDLQAKRDGIDTSAPCMLTANGGQRLKSRVEYDLERLGVREAHVKKAVHSRQFIGATDVACVNTLLRAATISSQPVHGCLAVLLGSATETREKAVSPGWCSLLGLIMNCMGSWLSGRPETPPILIRIFVWLSSVMLVAVPFCAPRSLEELTGRDDFVWMMLPGLCGCPGEGCIQSDDCRCVDVNWRSIAILVLGLRGCYRLMSAYYRFLQLACLDAARRYRSLSAWGSLLEAEAWPQLKAGVDIDYRDSYRSFNPFKSSVGMLPSSAKQLKRTSTKHAAGNHTSTSHTSTKTSSITNGQSSAEASGERAGVRSHLDIVNGKATGAGHPRTSDLWTSNPSPRPAPSTSWPSSPRGSEAGAVGAGAGEIGVSRAGQIMSACLDGVSGGRGPPAQDPATEGSAAPQDPTAQDPLAEDLATEGAVGAAAPRNSTWLWRRSSAASSLDMREDSAVVPLTLQDAKLQMDEGIRIDPLLDIRDPGTLYSWFAGYQCMFRFGERYKSRIDRFISFLLVWTTGMTGTTIVLLVYVEAVRASWDLVWVWLGSFGWEAGPGWEVGPGWTWVPNVLSPDLFLAGR